LRDGVEAPRELRRSVENIDIARIFQQVADLLEIQGESQFRVRAYGRRRGPAGVDSEDAGEPSRLLKK